MTHSFPSDVPGAAPANRPAATVVTERSWSMDRFHWPSIVGGAFVALALFVCSAVLSRACGVNFTFGSVHQTGPEAGAIVWGAVASIICFGIGGLLAAWTTPSATRRYGALNGLMVWAVAVPVLVFWLGSGVGPMLGKESGNGYAMIGASNGAEAPAQLASARFGPGQVTESQGRVSTKAPDNPNYVGHVQAAAWWMLLSLGLGLISACFLGYIAPSPFDRTAEFRRTGAMT